MAVYRSTLLAFLLVAQAAHGGPLQDAAESGNLELINQSLARGSDLKELNAAGDPALVVAALNGHADAVGLLLDKGADIESRNKSGLTPLHAAAYSGRLDVAEMLIQKGAAVNDTSNFYKMSPLHAAAEEGHADMVALLLANKADVEAAERNGYTPLTQAGWRGYWEVAEKLMAAGAECQKAQLVGEPLFNECVKRQAQIKK